MEVKNTGGQPGDVLPPVLRLLETQGGHQILPLRYDRAKRVLQGIVDDYNVSGDDPAPTRSWSLADGRCDSSNPDHTLKENDALSLARNIPL